MTNRYGPMCISEIQHKVKLKQSPSFMCPEWAIIFLTSMMNTIGRLQIANSSACLEESGRSSPCVRDTSAHLCRSAIPMSCGSLHRMDTPSPYNSDDSSNQIP